jgi:thiamine-monophosphate kinase
LSLEILKPLSNELILIKHLSRRLKIGDDCACIPFQGKTLLLTVDTSAEGIHFDQSFLSPQQIGYRALACAISDIAAMAGSPLYALIALSIGETADLEFIDSLYSGMQEITSNFSVEIVGGDTISGEKLVISATIVGEAERPVLRSGAKEGELIGVSGRLGGARRGLILLKEDVAGQENLKKRYISPVPRIEEGKRLSSYVSSMIDISDGLLIDLYRLSEASKKGMQIEKERIPVETGATLEDALSGGDDYELLFTIPSEHREKIKGLGGCIIGRVIEAKGIFLDGEKIEPKGYDHFAQMPNQCQILKYALC